MAVQYEEIRQLALGLAEEERQTLMDELADSLRTEEERQIEQEWLDEAEARYADWEAGRSQSRPAEQVIAELRAKYGADRRA